MATMKTGMIGNIRGSNDDWTFWWSSISDVSVRKLLHIIFDAGSVDFN